VHVFKGIAISPGIAEGPIVVLDQRGLRLPPRSIERGSVPAELKRLDRGLDAACAEAARDEGDARARIGPQYADILAAHSRMIADPTLRRDARQLIERNCISAEHAVVDVLEAHASNLERLAGSHLAARAADVRDVEARILGDLLGQRPPPLRHQLAMPAIVLAHDVTPSEAATLEPGRVAGFATEVGGRSSHTAIVAAALEIPAVAGLGPFLEQARRCQSAIVDGDAGLVILDPDEQTRAQYRRAAAERSARFQQLASETDQPTETLDGCKVDLWCNIEFGGEVASCLQRGASGVGLFRTEFLFLNASVPPGEEEQFDAYVSVVRSLRGRPVTIRTLDLGADKLAGYSLKAGTESNPALGLRSLRLSLRDPAIFRPQLRAILRASAAGDVRILFPLVSTLDELRAARAMLHDTVSELRAQGHPVRENLPVGVMVEVPAAALLADRLAKEVDFFSIGTNDLIQYTLAVDRTNETVADLYSASDPAVLRLISMVVEAARYHGIPATLCGTMGGEPLYTILLVGLGIRQLSMPPHQLPEIKRTIRGMRLATAQAIAQDALRLETARDVAELLQAELQRTFAEQPGSQPVSAGTGASCHTGSAAPTQRRRGHP
jgi:phosphotransferase system enzyme I (PtsI)